MTVPTDEEQALMYLRLQESVKKIVYEAFVDMLTDGTFLYGFNSKLGKQPIHKLAELVGTAGVYDPTFTLAVKQIILGQLSKV